MFRGGVSSSSCLEGMDEEQANRVVAIRSQPEFFSLMHFCNTFRTALLLPKFEVEDLERALLVPTEKPFVLEVVCRLLETGYPAPHLKPGDWETVLAIKLAHRQELEQSCLNGNPLAETNFFDVMPTTRTLVLAQLCEWKLEESAVLHEEMTIAREEGTENTALIGSDAAGRNFYHDGGTNARIYREDRSDMRRKDAASPRWITICANLEEAESLSSSFARSRNHNERSLVEAIREVISPLVEAEEKKRTAAARADEKKRRALEQEALREKYALLPRKRSERLETMIVSRQQKEIQEEQEEAKRRAAKRLEEKKERDAAEVERCRQFIPERLRPQTEPSVRRAANANASLKQLAIGRRLRVWWQQDECWYEGEIESYNSDTGMHNIRYDDNEVELVNLGFERIEWLARVSARQSKPSLKVRELGDGEESLESIKEAPPKWEEANEVEEAAAKLAEAAAAREERVLNRQRMQSGLCKVARAPSWRPVGAHGSWGQRKSRSMRRKRSTKTAWGSLIGNRIVKGVSSGNRNAVQGKERRNAEKDWSMYEVPSRNGSAKRKTPTKSVSLNPDIAETRTLSGQNKRCRSLHSLEEPAAKSNTFRHLTYKEDSSQEEIKLSNGVAEVRDHNSEQGEPRGQFSIGALEEEENLTRGSKDDEGPATHSGIEGNKSVPGIQAAAGLDILLEISPIPAGASL